jgi:hypothetical protein
MVVLPVLLTCSLSLCSAELVARVTSSACAAFIMLPGASWLPHVVHLHCFLSLLSPIMFFLLTLECDFIFVDSAESPPCFPIPLLTDLFRVQFFNLFHIFP